MTKDRGSRMTFAWLGQWVTLSAKDIKAQVNSAIFLIKYWSGDERVVALHQRLVLWNLPQADPLHCPHHPHCPSCQGPR